MWKYILSIIIILLITACTNQATSTPTSSPQITSTLTSPPSLDAHFPQLINTPNAYYDLPADVGDLVLENGCLRLSGVTYMSAGDNFLLIWDARFSTRTEQGIVHVIDSITGEVLASTGDYIMVGNNGGDIINPTKKPIPDECHGPYLIVGDILKKVDKPSLRAHFPQAMEIQGGSWETTLKGKLVLENGCLRISIMENAVEGESFLLIWDLRFSTHTEQGTVQVVDSNTGKALLSVGDFVSIDGRVIEAPGWVRLKDSVPDECPGPYFHVGREESIKKIDKP